MRWRKAVEEALRKGGEDETRIKESEIESLGLEREREEAGGGIERKTRERAWVRYVFMYRVHDGSRDGESRTVLMENVLRDEVLGPSPRFKCRIGKTKRTQFGEKNYGKVLSETEVFNEENPSNHLRKTPISIFIRERGQSTLSRSLSLSLSHINPQGKTPPQSCEADLMWVGL